MQIQMSSGKKGLPISPPEKCARCVMVILFRQLMREHCRSRMDGKEMCGVVGLDEWIDGRMDGRIDGR